ncbi:MAG TPA: 4-hydroxythreonine-4-phosphate dehydrogenase PdxA [Chthonomonadaceae bacterium]|nr:4-hydroxythreonine-4-phosphate dehydrogenase PdxA [Chthonomonadaceae bacterium]
MRTRPKLAVTMGDPAGIGPEVVLKALADTEVHRFCRPVVFGDVDWLQRTARALNLPLCVVKEAEDTDTAWDGKTVSVRQATRADLSGVQPGQLSAEAGKAAAESVLAAAKAALAGEFDAIVTAPLNKEAIALGGFPYPGHTELLAEVTQTPRYGMLLLSGPLRVVHVSTHVSLREAIARVKTARVLECIRLGDRACRDLGITNPRIAVAGLNPHAGEHGLFGEEDSTEIAPAVAQALAGGVQASGPHPPDTIFARAANGEFDLVVAMYHDQGHIPVKLHGFDTGVNVTIGLPILRVSVDHGTAFDIAGRGIAREQSMLEALRVTVQMVKAKQNVALTPDPSPTLRERGEAKTPSPSL